MLIPLVNTCLLVIYRNDGGYDASVQHPYLKEIFGFFSKAGHQVCVLWEEVAWEWAVDKGIVEVVIIGNLQSVTYAKAVIATVTPRISLEWLQPTPSNNVLFTRSFKPRYDLMINRCIINTLYKLSRYPRVDFRVSLFKRVIYFYSLDRWIEEIS